MHPSSSSSFVIHIATYIFIGWIEKLAFFSKVTGHGVAEVILACTESAFKHLKLCEDPESLNPSATESYDYIPFFDINSYFLPFHLFSPSCCVCVWARERECVCVWISLSRREPLECISPPAREMFIFFFFLLLKILISCVCYLFIFKYFICACVSSNRSVWWVGQVPCWLQSQGEVSLARRQTRRGPAWRIKGGQQPLRQRPRASPHQSTRTHILLKGKKK